MIQLPSWLLTSHDGFSQLEAWYSVLCHPDMSVPEYARITGMSEDNVSRLLTQIKLWHDSCNNIDGIDVGVINNKNSINNKTPPAINNNPAILSKSHSKRELTLSSGSIAIDSSCKPELFRYVQNSEGALQLLSYWMDAYIAAGYTPLEVLDPRSLGVALKIHREGNLDRAKAVIEWLFTSDHYRATWLRQNGQVFLHNACNSKTIITNYNFSLTSREGPSKGRRRRHTEL